MYIHREGRQSTRNAWFAGCQTIPDNLFGNFLALLVRVKTFCDVLINGA